MNDDLNDELVDVTGNPGNQEVPQGVKTLAILSIVGNSLWLLIFLLAMMYFLVIASSFGGMMGSFMGDFMGLFVAVMLGLSTLHILGLVAAVKMMKGSKGAFIMYAIVTGLWALLCLLLISNGGGNTGGVMLYVISALSSIGFIIGFGTQMQNMPNKK
jgi:hypothetical protein